MTRTEYLTTLRTRPNPPTWSEIADVLAEVMGEPLASVERELTKAEIKEITREVWPILGGLGTMASYDTAPSEVRRLVRDDVRHALDGTEEEIEIDDRGTHAHFVEAVRAKAAEIRARSSAPRCACTLTGGPHEAVRGPLHAAKCPMHDPPTVQHPTAMCGPECARTDTAPPDLHTGSDAQGELPVGARLGPTIAPPVLMASGWSGEEPASAPTGGEEGDALAIIDRTEDELQIVGRLGNIRATVERLARELATMTEAAQVAEHDAHGWQEKCAAVEKRLVEARTREAMAQAGRDQLASVRLAYDEAAGIADAETTDTVNAQSQSGRGWHGAAHSIAVTIRARRDEVCGPLAAPAPTTGKEGT